MKYKMRKEFRRNCRGNWSQITNYPTVVQNRVAGHHRDNIAGICVWLWMIDFCLRFTFLDLKVVFIGSKCNPAIWQTIPFLSRVMVVFGDFSFKTNDWKSSTLHLCLSTSLSFSHSIICFKIYFSDTAKLRSNGFEGTSHAQPLLLISILGNTQN